MSKLAENSDVLENHFIEAFYGLERAIELLVQSYHEAPMPIWVHHDAESTTSWLEQALRNLWYRDGQPGNESAAYVGMVGAAPQHLQYIHEVNEAKHVLQMTGQALKSQAPVGFREAKQRIGANRQALQGALNDAGVARLHIKQAWRRLPLAEAPVRRVHFSWYSSGRAIKRVTVAEAEEALCRFDTTAAHIEIQRKALASLPSSEVLAQVKPQTSIMRANLTYFDPLPSLKMHVAMNVTMPLFIPLAEGEALPDHNEPATSPPVERQWPKRRDARLEEEPFLPSVHVHRYRREQCG